MAGLVVNPRARIFHGHEWVYGTEIRKTFGDPKPGDVVSLKDFRDRAMGSAIYNPSSQIVARRFSRRKQDLDLDFFRRRLERALQYRERVGLRSGPSVFRMVWSESDGLPGVIVDCYGAQVVFQTLTLAMDQRRDLIATALDELLQPGCIVERNDSSIRAAEGMDDRVTVLKGEPAVVSMQIDGVPLTVDVLEGQKTGLYLDQLDNYRKVAELSPGKRVLDCFSNQGGFALHAALAGASEVHGVESSESALDLARANAAELGKEITWHQENVFDLLKKQDSEGQKWDHIILDPPSFARNRKSLRDAMRGYKEIHLRSLKMLEPGGILSTFVCSHHVDRQTFLQMIRDASVDARRTLRLVSTYTQRIDHPVLPSLPESEYLHGFSFEVIPSW